MEPAEHWEHIYTHKDPSAVSWYQPHAIISRQFIRQALIPYDAAIIDIGGGASTLIDDLVEEGYSNCTVLDISQAAISIARQRLKEKADHVQWLVADITEVNLQESSYDLWHDRAVFHFLTKPEQRHQYVAKALYALKPGGHIIISTFAKDGPTKCSGLEVMRYNHDEIHAEFGTSFTLVQHSEEYHHTPFSTEQHFVYCYCRKS